MKLCSMCQERGRLSVGLRQLPIINAAGSRRQQIDGIDGISDGISDGNEKVFKWKGEKE